MPKVKSRKVLTSESVPETDSLQQLTIHTKCPRKWLFVDLEEGVVWAKTHKNGFWKNVGYVDCATPTSIVILPSAAAAIPHFKL